MTKEDITNAMVRETPYFISPNLIPYIHEAMSIYAKLAFDAGRSVTFIDNVTGCFRSTTRIPDKAEFETFEDFTEDKSRVKFKYEE